MLQTFRRALWALAMGGVVISTMGFSLRGPFDTWQTADIGYDPTGTDNGGPMNLNEGYRWNVKTITYGMDASFLHYFGPQGSNAIVQAMETFNRLPPFSKMSADLSEFPLDTMKANYVATSLGIIDVKSMVMGFVLAELGVAPSERYVWTLRGRVALNPGPGFQYLVIQRNFDPVRFVPSPYVNNVLYTYAIVDPIALTAGSFADAVEVPLDPDALHPFSAVSSMDGLLTADSYQQFNTGNFYTGLTRDDIAGLRYLYRKAKENSYMETLIPGATNGLTAGGGAAWTPATGSNVLVSTALRTGVDKIEFKYVGNDSVFGGFTPRTNSFIDSYYTNNFKTVKQGLQRVISAPDILFSAADLGLGTGGTPFTLSRTTAAGSNWVNNAAINTQGPGPTAGPGQINPTMTLTFNKVGNFIVNQSFDFLDQANSSIGWVWGSYDGTTNAPVIYPIGTTIQDREMMVFTSPQ